MFLSARCVFATNGIGYHQCTSPSGSFNYVELFMHIIVPLSFLAVIAISRHRHCTKSMERKAKVWKTQAKYVKSFIESLKKAERNKHVFTDFGDLIEKNYQGWGLVHS